MDVTLPHVVESVSLNAQRPIQRPPSMPAFDPDRWITHLLTCSHLPEPEMKLLCDRVRSILLEESNIQPVASPVTICGDIHGQFWDLKELLRKGGDVPATSYIFMASRCLRGCSEVCVADMWCGSRVILWIGGFIVWRRYRCYLRSRRGMCCCMVCNGLANKCMLRYPDKVTLLRGNHESRQITQVYGFYGPS